MGERVSKRRRHGSGLGQGLPPFRSNDDVQVEVIDLLESESDDDPVVVVPPPEVVEYGSNDGSISSHITQRPLERYITANGSSLAENSDEVEATVVLKHAVVYPHARADCRAFAFEPAATDEAHEKNVKSCSKCYCYVCDILASVCTVWNVHCMASDKQDTWRDLRARFRSGTGKTITIPPSLLPPKLRGAVACNDFHPFITGARSTAKRRALRAPSGSESSGTTNRTVPSASRPRRRTFRTSVGSVVNGTATTSTSRVIHSSEPHIPASEIRERERRESERRESERRESERRESERRESERRESERPGCNAIRDDQGALRTSAQEPSRVGSANSSAKHKNTPRHALPEVGREYVVEFSDNPSKRPTHLRDESADTLYLIGKIDFWRPYCSHRTASLPPNITQSDLKRDAVHVAGEGSDFKFSSILLKEVGVLLHDPNLWDLYLDKKQTFPQKAQIHSVAKELAKSDSCLQAFLSKDKNAIGGYVFHALQAAVHVSLVHVRWEVFHYPGSESTNPDGAFGCYHLEHEGSSSSTEEAVSRIRATHAWRKTCASRLSKVATLNDANCCRLRAWIHLLPAAFGSSNVRIAANMAVNTSPYAFHAPLDGGGPKVPAPKSYKGAKVPTATATSLIGKVLIPLDFANFALCGLTDSPTAFFPKSYENRLLASVFRGTISEDSAFVAAAEASLRTKNALIQSPDNGLSQRKLFTIEGILSSPLFTVCEASSDERAPQPSNVSISLRPYQLQTLRWMENQEKRCSISDPFWVKLTMLPFVKGVMQPKWKVFWYSPVTGNVAKLSPPRVVGGLLCEEMGLGKTLEVVSLVCNSMDDARAFAASGGGTEEHPVVAKTTLIVTPVSLLQQWEWELFYRTVEKLSVCLWYGQNRPRDPYEIAKFDVCLTTYSTLASGKHECALQSIQFFRVVIDESTFIKGGASSAMFAALLSIHSHRRWAVSGTPFANDMKSFLPVLRFLGVSPWSSPHLANELFADFALRQSRAVVQARSVPLSLSAMPALALQHVLKSLMMRHIKTQTFDGKPLVELPAPVCRLVKVALSPVEYNSYVKLRNECLDNVKHILRDDQAVLRSIVTLHAQLSRLRLATSGIFRLRSGNAHPPQSAATQYVTVPTANAAKLQRLLHDIRSLRASDPQSKFVVFTEFDGVRQELKKQMTIVGIGHSYLEGSMSAIMRGRVLREFREDPDKVALILSYKFAHGLTLTCANVVMLLDPTLSQEVELQAFHRVWRIGQTRVVQVLTYVAVGTVDEQTIEVRQLKGQMNLTDAKRDPAFGNEKLPHAVVYRKLFGYIESNDLQ